MFQYFAYGIPVISTLKLTAFAQSTKFIEELPIHVFEGKVPDNLEKPPLEIKPFSVFNDNELIYSVPNVARYYVRHGKEIIVERIDGDWNEVLLFFYSNCMAAALFQRNIIPFHVSGVFVSNNKVLLFAAPSRIGKSTTSVMLQQKGYSVFTDDTAILTVENGKCYAQASYPMIRLWQNTINEQFILKESEKIEIRKDIEVDKFGFMFHTDFISDKIEVAGIVFLEAMGHEIRITKIKPSETIRLLGNNIYRKQWLKGMKKQILQFNHLAAIVNVTPAWQAIRPIDIPTFKNFAEAIEDKIITEINQ
jgi:hypothetical protein